MGVDLSVYRNFLAAPKSVADYDEEFAKQQHNALALQVQKQQIADAQRLRGQKDAFTNALGANDITTDAGRSQLFKVAPDYAPSVLKALAESQDKFADSQKKRADVGKTEGETLDAGLKRYRSALDFIDTADGAARWYQAQYADPVVGPHLQKIMPMEQTLQGIPRDPQGFADWRERQALGMDGYTKKLQKDRELTGKENNDLIGPDGKPNTALIGIKTGLARAGAASTNVNVSTGQKGFDNEIKLRDNFKSEPVYKAHQEMQAAYSQIQQSLKQGTPAGDLAGATKIMKLLDPGSVVRESELGMAMAATGLLDRAQNYAQNIISGNKLTPKQRVEFQQLADALYGESVNSYNSKRGEYIKLGGEYGLNADRAIGQAASVVRNPSPQSQPKPQGGAKFLGFE